MADLRLDPAARRAWRGDRELELSKTEFDLLELLVRNAGIVLEHTTIYDRIWGYDFGPDSKNLAVYISYLRRKVEEPRASQADPHRAGRRLHPAGLMSLRVKLVVALALLAAVASAAIGWLAYRATADRLMVEVDRSLDRGGAGPVRSEGPARAQGPVRTAGPGLRPRRLPGARSRRRAGDLERGRAPRR